VQQEPLEPAPHRYRRWSYAACPGICAVLVDSVRVHLAHVQIRRWGATDPREGGFGESAHHLPGAPFFRFWHDLAHANLSFLPHKLLQQIMFVLILRVVVLGMSLAS
jgi:hypothetical protein